MVDSEELNKLLSYEKETGKLFWRRRPDARPQWNGRFAGKEAFTSSLQTGYKQGEIYSKSYLAHRVIWCMSYGLWPDGEIDHINGIRDDNRLLNLRDVSRAENGRNLRLKSNNTSGFSGVSLHKASGKWRARVKYNGIEHHLGLFASRGEAADAVKSSLVCFEFHDLHGTDKDAPKY